MKVKCLNETNGLSPRGVLTKPNFYIVIFEEQFNNFFFHSLPQTAFIYRQNKGSFKTEKLALTNLERFLSKFRRI
jgi:hypothetical protein